jgi:formylglycine-generating enzyme
MLKPSGGFWAISLILAFVLVAVSWKVISFLRSKTKAATGTFSVVAEPVNYSPSAAFTATVPKNSPAPAPTPDGMVWVPGGEFSMGAEPSSETLCSMPGVTRDSLPVHRVYVDGFWMDQTEVTNEQFEKFVKASRYVTVAERTPRAEDFPAAPSENLVAGSSVFSPPDHPVPLTNYLQWWVYVRGANWRHPTGPHSDLKGREKFPVVQIAYEDVVAYAKWAGKRLPTEAEWEFAARGGLSGKLYPWGDDLRPEKKSMANTFQGDFPFRDSGEDGYAGIAPVARYVPNGYGLYDVAGNVWEWCSDWYRADYYEQLVARGGVSRNPQGPNDSSDDDEPGVKKRVQRGGSFLCTDQYCSRYMVGTRGKGEITSASNHVGFRLVKDVK